MFLLRLIVTVIYQGQLSETFHQFSLVTCYWHNSNTLAEYFWTPGNLDLRVNLKILLMVFETQITSEKPLRESRSSCYYLYLSTRVQLNINVYVLSAGVVNNDGKLWKDQRRFLHERLRKFGMAFSDGGRTHMEARISVSYKTNFVMPLYTYVVISSEII